MSVSTTEFRERVADALAAGKIAPDGHTLFRPEFYAPHFTEAELNEAGLIQTHKSDGTPKGTIFSAEGELIDELHAVYNLDFLAWVARRVGVTDYPQAFGRGSRAVEWVQFISKALA